MNEPSPPGEDMADCEQILVGMAAEQPKLGRVGQACRFASGGYSPKRRGPRMSNLRPIV